MSQPTTDPFGTAALRAAVLDAWAASPTRLREDANVEEDYALGAYRDRLVVELAQNAADAARAAHVPGRLLLRVDTDGLTAANTGAPLDRAGVESLAAMRASNKDAGAVGRFGVGFAAVLAVTDAPEVRSRDGGVRFDREATRTALSAGRGDAPVPALRLPFPTDDPPPVGYDTAVVLPWRDTDARRLADDAVRQIDDALLIALPSLDEVVVEIVGDHGIERHEWQASRDTTPMVVTYDGSPSWWRLVTAAGGVAEEEEEPLPHEERLRRQWSATVALPVTAEGAPVALPGGIARVVHAPTPTDDALDLPVLVVADFPLDATRRRVVEGDGAADLVDAVATAYVSHVTQAAQDHGAVAATLVPEPALVGWVDNAIRSEVRDQLQQRRWVARALDGQPTPVKELVALDPPEPNLVRALAPHLLDLLHPDWIPYLSTLRGLGLTVRPVAEVWDTLAPLSLSPAQWHEVYDSATGLDATSLEGLPVLLADGRVVRGARGVVLADGHGELLALLGADVADEGAEHPLLTRLGARPFEVATVLDASFVRRVEDAAAHDEAEARQMVLAAARLLADSGIAPGELAVLGDVPVPTDEGWLPAASVVLPGSPLDAVAAGGVPRLDAAMAGETTGWPALGVLATLVPVVLPEQPLDPDVWDGLAVDGGGWCEAVADRLGVDDPGELLAVEATAVRGVEMVGDLRDAIGLLAEPEVRRAVTRPAVVLTVDGRRVEVPSPAGWWLGEAPLLDGRCPVEVRLPGDDRLAPFFPVVDAPEGADPGLLVGLGVHTTLERWLETTDGVDELLESLADPEVVIDLDLLAALYAALGEVDELPEPPEQVRAVVGAATQVVDAADAVVAVAPHHALVLRTPHVPGRRSLAEVLDLEVSGDARCDALDVAGSGAERPVPPLPGDALRPAVYREHDQLTVGGVDIDWWVTDDGEVHAATLDGLARGLAWASGQWRRRFELSVLLEQPAVSAVDRVERVYDV